MLNHIDRETHARTLKKKLEKLYAQKNANNKMYLIKQMMIMRYQDGTPIIDYLNVF